MGQEDEGMDLHAPPRICVMPGQTKGLCIELGKWDVQDSREQQFIISSFYFLPLLFQKQGPGTRCGVFWATILQRA